MPRSGKVIPWEVVERHIRATHPYEVFMLRGMLAVPYFEKVSINQHSRQFHAAAFNVLC